ncbi:MAG: class I SAM-dependent methyltransferase [Pedobacter sp.]|nr:MAG: class I SAM-dependent methyltransferase [Pedobacter sp.]
MKNIFKILRSIYHKLLFCLQNYLFKKITNSRNAWTIFDKSNIPGFGTNLLRTYFPIYATENVKQSFSNELIATLENVINNKKHLEYDTQVIDEIYQLLKLSKNEKDCLMPYLDNHFFGVFDAAILGTLMKIHQPSQIIEIGSGISTRYMHLFKEKFNLPTKIICVDPFPRVEIEQVADQIYNLPLELAIKENTIQLAPGDFLFMDGSHYVFQGNDTLTFFFNLLPSLPAGVIIHIHDIYLPYDYDSNVSQQLWGEQYILAAMLMNGLKNMEILYPAYYVSCNNQKIRETLQDVSVRLSEKKITQRKSHHQGYSFWIKKNEY